MQADEPTPFHAKRWRTTNTCTGDISIKIKDSCQLEQRALHLTYDRHSLESKRGRKELNVGVRVMLGYGETGQCMVVCRGHYQHDK